MGVSDKGAFFRSPTRGYIHSEKKCIILFSYHDFFAFEPIFVSSIMVFLKTLKPMKKFFFLFFLSLFFSSAIAFGKEPVTIRVVVFKDKSEVILSVIGSFEVISVKNKEVLLRARDYSGARITSVPEGLKLKDKILKSDAISIIPKKKIAVTVNKRRYRGIVSVFKEASGKMLIVNTLDIESYVKGVLYREISNKWPMEAIKAQSVAVRTYAMYQAEVMKNKNYDVAADTSSQVYGGYLAETSKTNRAVNLTKGEFLLYKNRLFPTYFHATCGGITEKASELWKVDIEPLSGERVCGFCSASPHYFWKAQTDFGLIQEKLGVSYTLSSELKNVAVAERNATGRVRSIELEDALDTKQVISAKDFRAALGPDILRSTNFSIIIDKERVTFAGKGWGHGVGLCQWGALGMSKKGLTYDQILEFYYPGAEIVRLL